MTQALSLTIPADPPDLVVLRTLVMAAVGRTEVGIDTVADAGLLVDEAASLLMTIPGSSSIGARIELGTRPRLELETDASPALWPPEDFEGSIAETVLESLTQDLLFSEGDSKAKITLGM